MPTVDFLVQLGTGTLMTLGLTTLWLIASVIGQYNTRSRSLPYIAGTFVLLMIVSYFSVSWGKISEIQWLPSAWQFFCTYVTAGVLYAFVIRFAIEGHMFEAKESLKRRVELAKSKLTSPLQWWSVPLGLRTVYDEEPTDATKALRIVPADYLKDGLSVHQMTFLTEAADRNGKKDQFNELLAELDNQIKQHAVDAYKYGNGDVDPMEDFYDLSFCIDSGTGAVVELSVSRFSQIMLVTIWLWPVMAITFLTKLLFSRLLTLIGEMIKGIASKIATRLFKNILQ